MPYIGKENRRKYDPIIRQLVEMIPEDVTDIDGHLNYIITKILKSIYKPKYFNYNRAIGMLECAKLEFYRVVVAPYEDEKRKQHGDV